MDLTIRKYAGSHDCHFPLFSVASAFKREINIITAGLLFSTRFKNEFTQA